mmetsp:Transcript_95099/g.290874  ORF Transcript_95099/g.290874 Transcript_95099/m.290874 type:complete len:241 (-) Transcript_95099:348-1070(-)
MVGVFHACPAILTSTYGFRFCVQIVSRFFKLCAQSTVTYKSFFLSVFTSWKGMYKHSSERRPAVLPEVSHTSCSTSGVARDTCGNAAISEARPSEELAAAPGPAPAAGKRPSTAFAVGLSRSAVAAHATTPRRSTKAALWTRFSAHASWLMNWRNSASACSRANLGSRALELFRILINRSTSVSNCWALALAWRLQSTTNLSGTGRPVKASRSTTRWRQTAKSVSTRTMQIRSFLRAIFR